MTLSYDSSDLQRATTTRLALDNAGARFELAKLDVETPAFVYDESRIVAAATRASAFASQAGCKILYTLKPFAIVDALRLIADQVAGFSASSVFEAQLARQVLGVQGEVHVSLPAAAQTDIAMLDRLSDYITFNSLSQWTRLQPMVESATCGLRINPQLSFVSDPRYDPCRIGSKLGVPIDQLIYALSSYPSLVSHLRGLHFHSNCDSDDFGQLYETTLHLHERLGAAVFHQIEWLNMGGGYLFDEGQDISGLCGAVQLLTDRYGLKVFIEPGAGLVRDSGYLVATILDILVSDDEHIAVLDTSVNHLPEVFEYRFAPDVVDSVPDGAHLYTLAGNSCLGGDLFGKYAFAEPLTIGALVVFHNVGAYSLVKANMFNGINLPSVYALTPSGETVLKRRFTYEDFSHSCGVRQHDRS